MFHHVPEVYGAVPCTSPKCSGLVKGSHLTMPGRLGTPEGSSWLVGNIVTISWDVKAMGIKPAML